MHFCGVSCVADSVRTTLSFFSFSFRTLLQVAKYLHPRDLLYLARTSKSLRAILMTKNARHIWAVSLGNIKRLPGCFEDMSEPQYAAFLFEQVCSAKVRLRLVSFTGRSINFSKFHTLHSAHRDAIAVS
jgi:hypothetical protein